jgi:hypothetical protein
MIPQHFARNNAPLERRAVLDANGAATQGQLGPRAQTVVDRPTPPIGWCAASTTGLARLRLGAAVAEAAIAVTTDGDCSFCVGVTDTTVAARPCCRVRHPDAAERWPTA